MDLTIRFLFFFEILPLVKESSPRRIGTRTNAFFQEPELSVTRSKQKKITMGANYYIQENDIDLDIRFDIIAITLFGNTINHIEDAFYQLV